MWRSVEAKRGSPSVCSSEEDDREHLRGEDAQEGAERIDGGSGGVGAGDVRGEGAGGSVMLPASRPLRSKKFVFKTARAKMPMSMSGTGSDARDGGQREAVGRNAGEGASVCEPARATEFSRAPEKMPNGRAKKSAMPE